MSERTKVLALAVGEDLVGAFRTAGASLPGVDMEIGPMRPAQVRSASTEAPPIGTERKLRYAPPALPVITASGCTRIATESCMRRRPRVARGTVQRNPSVRTASS